MPQSATPRLAAIAALALLLFGTGCAKHRGTLAPTIKDPVVFADQFGSAVDFQAFGGSKLDAVSVDTLTHYDGNASIMVTVPGPSDPSGGYAGGAFTTSRARDLSGYDALTFWAKANRPIAIDVVGLGNDNTGTSKYEASRKPLPVTMTWTKYVIPIPNPARLTAEKGLFFFAEGPESGAGSTIWFDDIQFEKLGTLTNSSPRFTTQTLTPDVGSDVAISNTRYTVSVDGVGVLVGFMQGYFDFTTSNDTVATANGGVVSARALGRAVIKGSLAGVAAPDSVILNTNAAPTTAAPAPTVAEANVISLFSNTYTNVPVDTWSASWDAADETDITIGGNDVKKYTNLVYAGIEFTSSTVDASAETAFHMDVWSPRGTTFKVKLVDFGADGAFGGGDDSEHELTFTTPATFTTGSWKSLEIPLSDFTNLTARAHLAQLIISGDVGTAYVDNVYFHH